MSKVIGIIGGMGPMATVDLFSKIVSRTDADCDQQHAHIIIDNNTKIPDRSAAILSNGEDPLPALIGSAKRLVAAGADVLMIACNTAHYFYDGVQQAVDVPVLHMPRETAKKASELGYKKCGLLATAGMVKSGIYARAFEEAGVELIVPDHDGQKAVMKMIYDGVKAGKQEYDVTDVNKAIASLKEQGAECFILGCTELPLAVDMYGISETALDPTSVLASAALKAVGVPEKK